MAQRTSFFDRWKEQNPGQGRSATYRALRQADRQYKEQYAARKAANGGSASGIG